MVDDVEDGNRLVNLCWKLFTNAMQVEVRRPLASLKFKGSSWHLQCPWSSCLAADTIESTPKKSKVHGRFKDLAELTRDQYKTPPHSQTNYRNTMC